MAAVSANVPRSLVTTQSELNQPTLHMLVAGVGLVHTRTGGSGGVSPSISFSRVLCPIDFSTFAKPNILQTEIHRADTGSDPLGSSMVASQVSRDPTLGRAQDTDVEPRTYIFEKEGALLLTPKV